MTCHGLPDDVTVLRNKLQRGVIQLFWPASLHGTAMQERILTINAGSSTIKFAVFCRDGAPDRVLTGKVDGVGDSEAALVAAETARGGTYRQPIRAGDHREGANSLIDWITEWNGKQHFQAIGHRVVHAGTKLERHQAVTPELIEELRRIQSLDIAHLPREIALMEAFAEGLRGIRQIACFDTEFHRAVPRMAQLLPVPRTYFEAGVRRLGFHGLSYMYLMEELRRLAGPAADGRIILAHLGSGASITAMSRGRPVDTSMSFTPTSGLVMSTRPGDLDPGLLVHIMRTEKLTPEQMNDFINQRCGLLGVSGGTSDMRELISNCAHDERAREAFDLFCYQAKKWIGAYTAVLGGLDTLVFSGGIGEHSPEVRSAICSGLEFLGLRISPDLNSRHTGSAGVISLPDSPVVIRVLPTDEELMIARIVFQLTSETA
jgi:acetate kinase